MDDIPSVVFAVEWPTGGATDSLMRQSLFCKVAPLALEAVPPPPTQTVGGATREPTVAHPAIGKMARAPAEEDRPRGILRSPAHLPPDDLGVALPAVQGPYKGAGSRTAAPACMRGLSGTPSFKPSQANSGGAAGPLTGGCQASTRAHAST